MKKLIVFLFMSCWSVFLYADPWGAMSDYDQGFLGSEQQTDEGVGENYLLAQILAGEPVRVYIYGNEMENQQKDYQRLIFQSYNRWFSDTAQFIRHAKREKEFEDILPLLERGIDIQFVSKEEADIMFFILPLKEIEKLCGGSAGCYMSQMYRKERVPRIFLPQTSFWTRLFQDKKVNIKGVGLHEIGHSLGLSDQYPLVRALASHPVFSSETAERSVMNMGHEISCDDADGLINLIDWTRGMSRGGETGWRSLCADRETFYSYGQPNTKGPYFIFSTDSSELWHLLTYQNGLRVNTQLFPMKQDSAALLAAPLQETVLQRDGAGRPVLSQGKGGELVYYSYVYDRRIRLVTKDNEVLLAELRDLEPKQKGQRQILLQFVGEDGNVSLFERYRSVKNGSQKGIAHYISGWNLSNPTFNLHMEFDEQGRVIKRKGGEKTAALPPSVQKKQNSSTVGYLKEHVSLCIHGGNEELAASVADEIAWQALQQTNRRKEERLKNWYLSMP